MSLRNGPQNDLRDLLSYPQLNALLALTAVHGSRVQQMLRDPCLSAPSCVQHHDPKELAPCPANPALFVS
jgi:hypothetical protein